MNLLKSIIILTLTTFLLLSSCGEKDTTIKKDEITYEFDSTTVEVDSIHLTTTTKYPVFFRNGEPITTLNIHIKNYNDSLLNYYIENYMPRNKEEYAEYADIFDLELLYEIESEIIRADEDVISIRTTHYYYSGGAHGNYFFESVNYDSKNDLVLRHSDIFGSKNYLPKISELSRDELYKSEIGELKSWIDEGTEPSYDNFGVINIYDEGIEITFGPYQVASYADGAQFVKIPFTKLEEMVNPTIVKSQQE